MAEQASSAVQHSLLDRIHGKYQRLTSRNLFRRLHTLPLQRPIISFTFDDFPVSAIRGGGEILVRHGFRGTYYVSLGLCGTRAPTGQLFSQSDLEQVIADDHELGCHTFNHSHSWETNGDKYEQSIASNAKALDAMYPGKRFVSFSYPIAEPRPSNKRIASRHFSACRGGGQIHNGTVVDLALLRSFFLEKTRGDLAPVYRAIDNACNDKGWLIFSTHDVCDDHTPYGCTPAFFEKVVSYAAKSGAEIQPVAAVVGRLGIRPTSVVAPSD